MPVADHPLDECQQRAGVTADKRFRAIAAPGGNLLHQPFVGFVLTRHSGYLASLAVYMRVVEIC